MKDKPKNVAASVRQRLLNVRKGDQEFQRLLVQYAIERFLYRLSQSPMRDRFVLKGAVLFALWAREPFRSTGDLDLLGFVTHDAATLRQAISVICSQPVSDDGLEFDPKSIRIDAIREEQEYQGMRVRIVAKLGTAAIPLQIDIGFGDVVHPGTKELEYPPVLADLPAARIRTYPPETVIAEKLEAMVQLGEVTSRLKDFYDLWALLRTFSLNKDDVALAVRKTFANRGTALPQELPSPLLPSFADRRDKQEQWEAFLRRTTPSLTPPGLGDLLEELRLFLVPVIEVAQRE